MKLAIYRFSLTALAIILGIGFILVLTFMGKKTKGPIDDAFSAVGQSVSSIENDLILNSRENTRSKTLAWFNISRLNTTFISKTEKILYGAYDNESNESFQSLVDLEDTLHTTFPIIHFYTAWGSKETEQFPLSKVQAIINLGSMPLITWEPWLSDFDASELTTINSNPVKRDFKGCKDITAGKYDLYLDKWSSQVKKVSQSIMIRLGHEMNDPYRYPWGPQNNKPEDFVAMWKHVVDRFKANGVKNVIWVWSPHPAYGLFDQYYPGDNYVDWVGVGTLNYGTVATWSQWWSFDQIFGNYYTQLAKYKKPIILTEFGSLDIGGDRSKWYSDALGSVKTKYPAVKSIVFYHCSDDNTTTYKSLNWYLINDSTVVQVIKRNL